MSQQIKYAHIVLDQVVCERGTRMEKEFFDKGHKNDDPAGFIVLRWGKRGYYNSKNRGQRPIWILELSYDHRHEPPPNKHIHSSSETVTLHPNSQYVTQFKNLKEYACTVVQPKWWCLDV